MEDWASRASFDVIGVAVFGKEFQTIKHPDAEVNHTFLSFFNSINSKARYMKIFRILALVGFTEVSLMFMANLIRSCLHIFIKIFQ